MSEDERLQRVSPGDEPEGHVPDLELADHLDGYWPSSKNVTQ